MLFCINEKKSHTKFSEIKKEKKKVTSVLIAQKMESTQSPLKINYKHTSEKKYEEMHET